MRVCFFARVRNRRMLEDMSFYSVDIQILRELGHEVVVCNRVRELPGNCNLYYIWWPGWGIAPILLSKILRKPSVLISYLHHQDRKYGYTTRSAVERFLMRCSLRYADCVVTGSEVESEGALAVAGRSSRLVYQGVEIDERPTGWEKRSQLVFSIGHLSSPDSIGRKGFDNVIRAARLVAREVPGVRFVLAGEKGERCGLDGLVAELGLQDVVSLPGRITNVERALLLRTARVLTQPAEWEGFGMAQVEAMACGLPVVTSAVGALPEVVGDCALFCDKNSPEQIAEQTIRLLQDRCEWERLSQAGYARASRLFSYENRLNELKSVVGQASDLSSISAERLKLVNR